MAALEHQYYTESQSPLIMNMARTKISMQMPWASKIWELLVQRTNSPLTQTFFWLITQSSLNKWQEEMCDEAPKNVCVGGYKPEFKFFFKPYITFLPFVGSGGAGELGGGRRSFNESGLMWFWSIPEFSLTLWWGRGRGRGAHFHLQSFSLETS